MNIWLYYALLGVGAVAWAIIEAAREDRDYGNEILERISNTWHDMGLWVRIDYTRRRPFKRTIHRVSAHEEKYGRIVYQVQRAEVGDRPRDWDG